MSVFIIAEAGVNHDGSLRKALDLATAAKDAGADAVKFQTGAPRLEMTSWCAAAPYQGAGKMIDVVSPLVLSTGETYEVASHCARIGIEFMSTPSDLEALRWLTQHAGVRRIKIGSGDVTNAPLLLAAAMTGLPVYLSTGASTLVEVMQAAALFSPAAKDAGLLTLMHCVSAYPAPIEQQNLLAMLTMREAIEVPVGFSDHTVGIAAAIAAAAIGASIIEKHITLDPRADGPDHKASTPPAVFERMVSQIRSVEAALGTGEKAPAPCEAENVDLIRKSLVAARPIGKGEKFTTDNIAIKRPGTGRHPRELWGLLGTYAERDYVEDEQL